MLVSQYHSGDCPKLTSMHKSLTSRARVSKCEVVLVRVFFSSKVRKIKSGAKIKVVGRCGEEKAGIVR